MRVHDVFLQEGASPIPVAHLCTFWICGALIYILQIAHFRACGVLILGLRSVHLSLRSAHVGDYGVLISGIAEDDVRSPSFQPCGACCAHATPHRISCVHSALTSTVVMRFTHIEELSPSRFGAQEKRPPYRIGWGRLMHTLIHNGGAVRNYQNREKMQTQSTPCHPCPVRV